MINNENNKGQVLVIFVLILPVIIMILALVVDIGLLYTQKSNNDNIVKDAIKYGLNNLNMDENTLNDKIVKLISSNIKDSEKTNVVVKNGIISISVTVNKPSIFVGVYKEAKYKIVSYYTGEIVNSTKEIRKG